MSGADILLLALVGLALCFALRAIRRRKKSGGCSCGSCSGACSSCGKRENCRKKE